MSGQGARLELRDLHYGFAQDEPLVTLDSLDLTPGQVVVLTGPSGSGKTTLLYLLSGLLVPVGGRVSWDGTDLAVLREGARDQWRRQNAGFVFQDFHLMPGLSAQENVELGLRVAGRANAAALARAALERLDLGARLRHLPAHLSTGERQRVAIARAVAHRPGLLLVDEPTAHLDRERAGGAMSLLCQAAQELGATLVVVTHDEQVAASLPGRLHISGRQESSGAQA